jgi:hypothetical protein
MICRASRDRLALALRRYAACRISNDALDDTFVDWRDRGAVAVKGMAWRLYSDMERHYATDRHAIRGELRRTIAQWIVFLHSEDEYTWPEYSFTQTEDRLLDLMTLGWIGRRRERRWQEFTSAGEYRVWPFVRGTELAARAKKPRYFAGISRS